MPDEKISAMPDGTTVTDTVSFAGIKSGDPTNYRFTGLEIKTYVAASASPGGSSGQIQYNNSSSFGGFTMAGDATLVAATGTITFATVNANVGTFQGLTVNAKGLVTAAVDQHYITGNQTITLSGDATGSGTTSIAVTNSKFNGGTAFGSMAGQAANSVTITGGSITGMPTPSAASDVANKSYVDAIAAGIQIKATATVATTAALPTNIYSNGASGVGATIAIVATGTLTVDGRVTALGDLVLVKNEATAANNGLYSVTTAGAIGVAAILTRYTDMNTATEFSGALVPVGNIGTANANSLWLANPTTPVTVGTTAIPFTQLNGATDLIPGANIGISGNTISVIATLPTTVGGLGITSFTSGGIIGATGTGTLASSVLLTSGALILGAGAGATPTPAGLGTATTVWHGNAGGAGSYASVSLTADVSGLLPLANIAAITSGLVSSNGTILQATTLSGASFSGSTLTIPSRVLGQAVELAGTLAAGTYDCGVVVSGGTLLNSYAHVASGTLGYGFAIGQPGTYTDVTGLTTLTSSSTTIDTIGTATAANVVAAGAHVWLKVGTAAVGASAMVTLKTP